MEEKKPLKEILEKKVVAYYTDIWKDIRDSNYQEWLNNFKDDDLERLNALFLLSKFTYFGNLEIRAMLKAVYRDLYKYPIIEQIRKENENTTNEEFINAKFLEHHKGTRFLGVGNPSESGVHLLYYFRQENDLAKTFFIHAHELFKSTYSVKDKKMVQTWANDEINHIVFLDDFCGKGSQAVSYIKDLVSLIKKLNKNCQVDYFVLVGNKVGLKNVKEGAGIEQPKAVFELDESFKCFSENSRYFATAKEGIDRIFCKDMCEKYGKSRSKDAKSPFGYNNDELMLSFFHNTPNNTLPIFWSDVDWYPIFNRASKIYRNHEKSL